MTNLQNMELARSIERHRHEVEHESSTPTLLQRAAAMLHALAERRDRS